MISRVFFALCLLSLALAVSGEIHDFCIDCFAKVEMGTAGKCNMDVGSLSCGTYQIKEVYWMDCGKPGGSYKACAANDECARNCIKSYMRKYENICMNQLGKKQLSCIEYGRIHNGGPYACTASWTNYYVGLMNTKCQSELSSIPKQVVAVKPPPQPRNFNIVPTDVSADGPSDSCLACFAKVEAGTEGVCGGRLCGTYQISQSYWLDCGKPGSSYEDCTKDDKCSVQCIRAYMKKYESLCKQHTGKSELSCLDYAKLHNGGPYGCKSNQDSHINLMRTKCSSDLGLGGVAYRPPQQTRRITSKPAPRPTRTYPYRTPYRR